MSAATAAVPRFRFARRKRIDPLGQIPSISLRPVPFAALLLTVLGFLLATEVTLIGQLLVGELLLVPVALLALVVGFRRSDRDVWRFVGLYLVTLVAYIIGDMVNGSELNDALRGWARISFLVVCLLAMQLIMKKSRFNLFPIAIGMTAGYLVMQRSLPFATIWKFYFSTMFVVAGLYAIARYGQRFIFLLSGAFLCAVATYSAIIDSRALSGLVLAVAGIMGARLIADKRFRTLFPIFLAGGAVFAGTASWVLLSQTNAAFGQRRTSANVSRIAAIYTASQTIAENPFIGVGSWAQKAEAANRHRQNVQQLGLLYDNESRTQGGHSVLLQAWTEAGVFAAIAFFYYFWRMLVALKWMLVKPVDRFYAVELFLLINGIWNCLFSPFGGAMRLFIAITSCICIMLAEEKKAHDREVALRRRAHRELEIGRILQRPSPAGLRSAQV